jgi:hypothetical protein
MPPFEERNGMLWGRNGPLVVDEVDVPSPHTRQYHQMEADIHHMDNTQAEQYATNLRQRIHTFNNNDNIDVARQEGRLAYRSWPADPFASSDIMDLREVPSSNKRYLSGYESLVTTRDPYLIGNAHRRFSNGTRDDPFTSAPSTLLGKDANHPENLWSGDGPGMVTSLLPEGHYVEMDALNRRAQHPNASPQLKNINAQLQNEVTRPHLFENKDLSSGVVKFENETVRAGKPGMRAGTSFADVRLRENATRYESYMGAYGQGQQDIHNEMAVHYRLTGKSRPAIEERYHDLERPQEAVKTGMAGFFGKLLRGARVVPPAQTKQVRRPIHEEDRTVELGHVLNTSERYRVLKK